MLKFRHLNLKMIRKWFKLNTCFVKVFKNSSASKSLQQKWIFENADKNYSTLEKNSSYNIVSPATIGDINQSIDIVQTFFNLNEKKDGKCQNSDFESGQHEESIAEAPVKTEFFEVKGPNGTAFLIEVRENDVEEVKKELIDLQKDQGDYFHFDQNVIGWFTMKCILEAEPSLPAKDQQRLAKVHAISSGSEEVHEKAGKFFFTIPLTRMVRAKRILGKFGYKISKISYRYQPRKKVPLEDRFREMCHQFMSTVERLPKVVSVINNFN